MSDYQAPNHTAVNFAVSQGYVAPDWQNVDFSLLGLASEPVWDHAAQAHRLEVSWPAIDGATGYRLAIYQGEALLEEITTTGLAHTFTGLAAETTYHLELTGLDGDTELDTLTLEVVTPMGLPGAVTNLQHSFTTDSLTFIWDEVEGADDYLLTLSRDGALVEELTTTELTATFSGLEDGIRYTLEIRGRRGPGEGESVLYEADTGFLAPATPINFHEVSRRIIAVEPGWELVEPDKVRQVRIQVLIGNDILYDEVKTEAATSRLFPVPMASTDYFVRVRAGNPGGWSDWLEGTASTLVYPLLDTRLGVIGAAYQEAPLYPDTWNGGSDAEGAGDADGRELEVDISILSANLMERTTEHDAISPTFSMGFFDRQTVSQTVTAPDVVAGTIAPEFEIFGFSKSEVSLMPSVKDESSLGVEASLELVLVKAARFDIEEFEGMSVHISLSGFYSERV